jgi:ubiquinone/menaquinone biosynthesis C-methylase UbiE
MFFIRKKSGEKNRLFDSIASAYGIFFGFQKRRYSRVIDRVSESVDISAYKNILDVGCGTGALCAALNSRGFDVTGIDLSPKMLAVAMGKQENKKVVFLQASVLERLPFEDKAFDVSIASFVAHGINAEERKIMYLEMARVTKHLVIIYDYNGKRSTITDIAERLEGGDYFNFIKTAEAELKASFHNVKRLDAGKLSTLYICEPKQEDKINLHKTY